MSTGRQIVCKKCGEEAVNAGHGLCKACYFVRMRSLPEPSNTDKRWIAFRRLVRAVSAPEAARLLGVSLSAIRRWWVNETVPEEMGERIREARLTLRSTLDKRRAGIPAPLYEDYEPVTLERLLERTMEG